MILIRGFEKPDIRYKPTQRDIGEGRTSLEEIAQETESMDKKSRSGASPFLEKPDISYRPSYSPHSQPEELDPEVEIRGISKQNFDQWSQELKRYTASSALAVLQQNARVLDGMSDQIKEALQGDPLFQSMIDAGTKGDYETVDEIVEYVSSHPEENPLIATYPFLRHLRGKVQIWAAIPSVYLNSSDLYNVEGLFPKTYSWLKNTADDVEYTANHWMSGDALKEMAAHEQQRIEKFLEQFKDLDACALRMSMVLLRTSVLRAIETLGRATDSFLQRLAGSLFIPKVSCNLRWFNLSDLDSHLERLLQSKTQAVKDKIQSHVDAKTKAFWNTSIGIGDAPRFTIRDLYNVFDNTSICSEETLTALVEDWFVSQEQQRAESQRLVMDTDPNGLIRDLDKEMESMKRIADVAVAEDVLQAEKLTPEQEIVYGWMLKRVEEKQKNLREWIADMLRYEHAISNGLHRYVDSFDSSISARNYLQFAQAKKKANRPLERILEEDGFLSSLL